MNFSALKLFSWATLLTGSALLANVAGAYPLDGYDHTHIRRLDAAGTQTATTLKPGAKLPMAEITVGNAELPSDIPAKDAALSTQLKAALGKDAARYGIAIIDISDPAQPRYIAHDDGLLANVGKMLVLAGLFNKLAELYPDTPAARERILRDTLITADSWAVYDEHTVPIYDPGARRVVSRQIRVGDTGNLWEYLDWMLSASNNGAASTIQQQLILLEQFGLDYPVAPPVAQAFLKNASSRTLGVLYAAAMDRATHKLGLDSGRIRQGSMFTRNGKNAVAGQTSYANPRDLVRLLLAIESGQFIDAWSSLEAKRLLYMTQRRIRYASHPVLNDAAVYFKSGSLYRCAPEAGFTCRKYMGNVENRLASIAIVESPAETPKLRYMVAVMSNVLRVNSAVAHQTLALRIHRLVEKANQTYLDTQGVAAQTKPLPPATLNDAEGR